MLINNPASKTAALRVHQIRWMRKVVLALLRRLGNFDVRVKHHYTGDPLLLHVYKHKGFWYHGRSRESHTLVRCQSMLKPSDIIFEVGGHIGYLSVLFAQCARRGHVYVFEPGRNNLPYLHQNTKRLQNVEVIEMAAGDKNGQAEFYLDPLTGQNNSILGDYQVFQRNKASACRPDAAYAVDTVQIVRLDDFAAQRSVRPGFVKIDAEGAELSILQGMNQIMRTEHPALMIEVTLNQAGVERILRENGYSLSDDQCRPIASLDGYNGNFFATFARNT